MGLRHEMRIRTAYSDIYLDRYLCILQRIWSISPKQRIKEAKKSNLIQAEMCMKYIILRIYMEYGI